MILLVLCRDGYFPDGAGPVNLAGRWSPGNAGAVSCREPLPDGPQSPMFVSPLGSTSGPPSGPALEGKIGTDHIPTEGENHYRVRSILPTIGLIPSGCIREGLRWTTMFGGVGTRKPSTC